MADFEVRSADNGDGCYLKMSFKEADKWNNMCLPDWGWKKLETLLDEVNKYLSNRATTPTPLDISKRYKVSDIICQHVDVHEIRNIAINTVMMKYISLNIFFYHQVEVIYSGKAHKVSIFLNDANGEEKKRITFPKSIWETLCQEKDRISDDFAEAKVILEFFFNNTSLRMN